LGISLYMKSNLSLLTSFINDRPNIVTGLDFA